MSREKKGWRGADLVLRLELDGRVLHEGRVSELAFPIQIGRKSVCVWSVPVEERSVSGLHAELSVRRGRELVIRDLGSRNGIHVMGAKVEEHRLAAGAQVSIGQCRLFVESFRDADDGNSLKYHRLEQLTGPGSPAFFDLKNPVTRIGSAVADGILCADLLVSKEHAQITRKTDESNAEACYLKDLGSRNGTLLNDSPVRDVDRMLCDGDVITVADVQFKFHDRKAPPPDPIMRKVVTAVVTLSLCGMGYFGFQWIFPSAKTLLGESQAYEMRGEFALAKAVLDKAVTARGGSEYKDEIARKRDDLDRWTETRKVWDGVCRNFAARKWIDASNDLGYLLDTGVDHWGWNTTTAHGLKKQARAMCALLQVFMEARKSLGGDMPDEARGREAEYLFGQGEMVRAALNDPEWTEALPTGKLREDMVELGEAIGAIVGDLNAIGRLTAQIKAPPDGRLPLKDVLALTEKFDAVCATLVKIGEASGEREERRKAEAEAAHRRFVTSPVVMRRCDIFVPVLQKFIESRNALVANISALVAFDEEGLVREIAFPSDQQCSVHPAFGEIRRAMEAANRDVCGDLLSSSRDQVSRLGRWGLDKADAPACVRDLLSADVMREVFRCDTIAGPYCRAERPGRSGHYDRILGVEEFANFLSSVADDRCYPETSGDLPAPCIADAIRFFRQSAAFIKYFEQPDASFLLSVGGSGNRLKEMAGKVLSLEEKRALLIDLWWNEEGDDRRRRVVSKGAAIALDAGRQFGDEEGRELKRELDAMRADLKALERRLAADPESVSTLRPAMLEIGLPRLMGLSRHWEQERKIGGAQ